MMSENEKAMILSKAQFLLDKGYVVKYYENSVTFVNSGHTFVAGYEKSDNIGILSIRFFSPNDSFNIGWIAFIRNRIKLRTESKLTTILQLLEYTQEHYNKITDYAFCEESRKLVEAYVLANKK